MKQTKYYATSTEYWNDSDKDNIQIAYCTVHDYAGDTEHTLGQPVVYYIKHGEGKEVTPITIVKEPMIVTQAQYDALLAGETITIDDKEYTYDVAETYHIKEA